jgi:hypothetical protein
VQGHQITNEKGGACGTYGGEGKCVRLLLRKPERKSPLGRPRCSWEDNININLKERGLVGMGWINLAEDRDKWRAVWNTAVSHWVV